MVSHPLFSNARSVRLSAVTALVVSGLVWSTCESLNARQASAQPAQKPAAALAGGVALDGPFTHANLTVYVVRGATADTRDYITLDEGLAAGSVSVRERGTPAGEDRAEVNLLEIENRSDKWLFLQAGDIVKGGKQDRTFTTDLILEPGSGPQPIEAFCVERGRWTPRGDGLAFRNSPGIAASAPLKRAIQSERSQQRVWQEVANAETRAVSAARAAGAAIPAEARLSSTGTYNAIVEDKNLSSSRDGYVTALLPRLRRHPNAIGLAVAINGHVTAADVYGSPALFKQLTKKLLSSYALEAVLALGTSTQVTAPTALQVLAFLSKPAAVRPATEPIGRLMQRSTRESEELVMYEYARFGQTATAKPGAVVVHQSYLKK
jgi:hypothetical protein